MDGPGTRRSFLTTACGLLAATSLAGWRRAPALQRTPQPMPSPNAPKNQNVPGGMDNLPSAGPSRLPVMTVDAPLIAAMVQQLYQMASELKQETDRTNLKDTLPVDFLKRTQQIEKLAKNIRNKASG